jgi:hypothetical protein
MSPRTIPKTLRQATFSRHIHSNHTLATISNNLKVPLQTTMAANNPTILPIHNSKATATHSSSSSSNSNTATVILNRACSTSLRVATTAANEDEARSR